jgi:hypothetical protein
VVLAAGTRGGYLYFVLENGFAATAPLQVQDSWPEVEAAGSSRTNLLDQLARNLREGNGFTATSYLPARNEKTGQPVPEETAHVSPGFPWLVSLAYRVVDENTVPALVRWCQCALGAITAGLYFLFARRAFRSLLVALLTGLLCACHPFWIVNTGEINDGVLATVLLAACLVFGTQGGETGDVFSSLVFGLVLAGLSLVRAALLPFALVGLLWFLIHCRTVPRGWLCALLAVLGFTNGLAAWSVRNYRTFEDVVPVVDSAYVHLWMGNNAFATGGPQSEALLESALAKERLSELRSIANQNERYRALAQDVVNYIVQHRGEVVRNRLRAGLYFLFGEAWFRNNLPGVRPTEGEVTEESAEDYKLVLNSLLLGIFGLGFLGWRWSHGGRPMGGLAALAVIWLPLPYILSHAETLWGPRLPLDGVLLCYVAFAVIYLLPLVRRSITTQPGT